MHLIFKFERGRDSSNPTIPLVPGAGGFYDLACKPRRNFCGGLRVDFQCHEIFICVGRKVVGKHAGTAIYCASCTVTVRFDTKSFQYKLIQSRCK